MEHAAQILTGYGIALGGLALLGARIVQRGRSLTKQVPEGQRRWMDVDDDD